MKKKTDQLSYQYYRISMENGKVSNPNEYYQNSHTNDNLIFKCSLREHFFLDSLEIALKQYLKSNWCMETGLVNFYVSVQLNNEHTYARANKIFIKNDKIWRNVMT